MESEGGMQRDLSQKFKIGCGGCHETAAPDPKPVSAPTAESHFEASYL